jgi:hypothetical protein
MSYGMFEAIDKYWIINHNPDLTETGCTTSTTLVLSRWVGFPAQRCCEFEFIEDFAYTRFGTKVAYVQRVAPTISWYVTEITKEQFEEYCYKKRSFVITLEIGGKDKHIEIVNEFVVTLETRNF